MDMCLRVLKERQQKEIRPYNAWKSVVIISHITFGGCRGNFFSHNLSRNSCIYNRQSNKQVFFLLEIVNIFFSDGG